MSEQSQEVSNFGVRFGEEFQGDGKLNLKVNVVINAAKAKEQMTAAEQETKNKFPTLNYSLLLTFINCQNAEGLNAWVNKIKNDEGKTDEDESGNKVPLSKQHLYKKLKELFNFIDLKTEIIEKNLYVHVTLKENVAEKVLEPFQILLESGLKDLAVKHNSLEGTVAFDLSSDEIFEMLKKDRILVPFLTKSKAKVTLSLDKDLSNSIEEVISNIDKSLLNSPQLQFLKYFKNFDIDLAFNSAEQLPDSIRQYIFPGKVQKLDQEKKEQEKQKVENQTLLADFLKLVPPNVSARLFIDEFAYVNISVSAAELLKVIEEYLFDAIKAFV